MFCLGSRDRFPLIHLTSENAPSTAQRSECAVQVDRVFMTAASEIFQDAPCKADIKIGTDWSFQAATA